MSAGAWLFAGCVVAAAYPYLIYPLLLGWLARARSKPPASQEGPPNCPTVAILVSAHNEELRIAEKLENFKSLQYPAGFLQLWVGVDGADDRTAEMVRASGIDGVHCLANPARRGKTTVLNDLARKARAEGAEVFVFTDVNAFFRPDAVRELVRPMVDPDVGLVSGRTVIRGRDGNSETEGAYYRLESWLKQREGALGWLPGADGAIYALRADLYTELDPALINDLAHPCQAVAAGKTARFAAAAVSEEEAGDGAEREFHRQTRMTAQAAFVLVKAGLPLWRARQWGMLWVLLSHKWARWVAGLWILAGVAALVSLGPWGIALTGLTLLAVGLAWRFGWPGGNVAAFFGIVHAAYLRGLWKAIRGERYVTWKLRAG